MEANLKHIADAPGYTWEAKVNHVAKELHMKKYDAWILLDTYRFTQNQIDIIKRYTQALMPGYQKDAHIAQQLNISHDEAKKLWVPYSMKMYEDRELHKPGANGELVKVKFEDYDLTI